MKSSLKIGVTVLVTFLVIVVGIWLGIQAQGGGPPPTHRLLVVDNFRTYLREHKRWPGSWDEMLAGLTPDDSRPLRQLMRGTTITPYKLADGRLMLTFEWKQFGYDRASIAIVDGKSTGAL